MTLIRRPSAPGPVLSGRSPKADWRDVALAWLDRWHRRSLWISVGLSVFIGVVYAIHLGTTLHYVDEGRGMSRSPTTWSITAHSRLLRKRECHPAGGRCPPRTAYEGTWAGGCCRPDAPFGWQHPRLPPGQRRPGDPVRGHRLVDRPGARRERRCGLSAPGLLLYPLRGLYRGNALSRDAGVRVDPRRTRRDDQGQVLCKAVLVGHGGRCVLRIPHLDHPERVDSTRGRVGVAPARTTDGVSASLNVFIVALLVVSVWVVRNEATMHQFIPVTDASGINLLQANSVHATLRAREVATRTAGGYSSGRHQGINSETEQELSDTGLGQTHPAHAVQHVERRRLLRAVRRYRHEVPAVNRRTASSLPPLSNT